VDFLRVIVPSCSNAATFQFNIDRDGFLPCLNKGDRQKYEGCLQRSSVMPSAQTLVTLASLAVIASCVLVVSWVGLALLGF
jgi:hypothetical protein